MDEHGRIFKYKLDFYYQSAIIYLVTLILYGGIRGNFVEKTFEYVMDDPILYVIIFFVAMSFVSLGLNYIRNRRLVVLDGAIVFRNRWHERKVDVSDIEWIHIGREARVQTSGRHQVIVFKLKGRRRLFRIRVGRYERERELVAEMTKMAAHLPKRKRPRWRQPGLTEG